MPDTWQIKGLDRQRSDRADQSWGCFIAIDVSSIMPLDAFQKPRRHVAEQEFTFSPKAAGPDQIYFPATSRRRRKGAAGRRNRASARSRRAFSGLADDLGIDLAAKLPHSVVDG